MKEQGENKTIAIGSDHAGYVYKAAIAHWLSRNGYDIIDAGPDSEASTDYPDHVHPVADAVEKGDAYLGIILCGSGNGAAMTANKHQGIRAALCWNNELASLARQHNDANILAIPARYVPEAVALSMVQTFLETPFEGGRHQKRVDKIKCS
ncbi:MAG: ribose 5-phosphate isomerase B [Saprospiraceae bacterium]|nr:ribose 5-phosphate isomerase B [Candidatus Opimibacter skivensis]MBP6680151.1 ribose 5-phosphate isomerase B [Saprospiraceae bacterium]